MNRKQFCQELLNHGIGFSLHGNKVKITYTTADFKPYTLMPIHINDIFTPRIEKRKAKPIKPQMRKYPTDLSEYEDYLQEKGLKSLEALEERSQKRMEKLKESRQAVIEDAKSKWRLDDEGEEKDQEEYEAVQEYNKYLQSLKRRLPGWRQLQREEG